MVRMGYRYNCVSLAHSPGGAALFPVQSRSSCRDLVGAKVAQMILLLPLFLFALLSSMGQANVTAYQLGGSHTLG